MLDIGSWRESRANSDVAIGRRNLFRPSLRNAPKHARVPVESRTLGSTRESFSAAQSVPDVCKTNRQNVSRVYGDIQISRNEPCNLGNASRSVSRSSLSRWLSNNTRVQRGISFSCGITRKLDSFSKVFGHNIGSKVSSRVINSLDKLNPRYSYLCRIDQGMILAAKFNELDRGE